jgi:hypothetical protein
LTADPFGTPPTSPLPIRFQFTDRANMEVIDAAQWLGGLSPSASIRFSVILDAALPALCVEVGQRLAAGQRPNEFDADASLVFAMPVYQKLVTTTKARRRRNPSGTWRLFYTLVDSDGDGSPDTLLILSVRHAAARPLSLGDEE